MDAAMRIQEGMRPSDRGSNIRRFPLKRIARQSQRRVCICNPSANEPSDDCAAAERGTEIVH